MQSSCEQIRNYKLEQFKSLISWRKKRNIKKSSRLECKLLWTGPKNAWNPKVARSSSIKWSRAAAAVGLVYKKNCIKTPKNASFINPPKNFTFEHAMWAFLCEEKYTIKMGFFLSAPNNHFITIFWEKLYCNFFEAAAAAVSSHLEMKLFRSYYF